jgi:hypothetical protein
MHAIRDGQRAPLLRGVATGMLLIQSIAAAGVGFAHISERISAPAAIEAQHGSWCVVVHDQARCPACQVVVSTPPFCCATPQAGNAPRKRPAALELDARRSQLFGPATAPRAPPTPSV